MSFLGKIFGFIVGCRLAGLIGGVVGLILGHMADKKLYELGSVSSSFFKKPLTRQSLFMQTTFAVLGHLSKAKGWVTRQDIEWATQLMKQLNLDQTNRQLAQDAFNRGKNTDFPIRKVMYEFRLGCGQQKNLLRMFLEVQLQAAFIDGHLHQNEKDILYTVASELGISQFQFEQTLAMFYASQQFARSNFYQSSYGYQHSSNNYQQQNSNYQHYQPTSGPTVEDAYKVLGVTASDDQKTIKRAYRKLMNEHHPDKLVSKGLPEEMMEMAKEKAQQIQAAYDLICKHKGWK